VYLGFLHSTATSSQTTPIISRRSDRRDGAVRLRQGAI
jgi:hypothetical protein